MRIDPQKLLSSCAEAFCVGVAFAVGAAIVVSALFGLIAFFVGDAKAPAPRSNTGRRSSGRPAPRGG